MLKQPFMVLNSRAVSTVTLAPRTGESMLLKNVYVVPTAGVTEFLTLQVDRQTVGFIHIGTTILNQLAWHDDDEVAFTIFEQLRNRGYNPDIPIAEGETLTISAPNNWTTLVAIYELYDAGDITSDMPNGSKSDEYIFLQYGSNIATITTAGYSELTDVLNPVEFPNFPFGDDVPPNTVIEILGIGFPDVTRAAFGVDDLRTNYIRFHKDREVLFDDSRLGLQVPGLALGGAINNTTYYGLGETTCPYGGESTLPPLRFFPEPLVFNAGDELTVEVSWLLSGGGATVQIGDVHCCLPVKVSRG